MAYFLPNDLYLTVRRPIIIGFVPPLCIFIPIRNHVPICIVILWISTILEHFTTISKIPIRFVCIHSINSLENLDSRITIRIRQNWICTIVVFHPISEPKVGIPRRNLMLYWAGGKYPLIPCALFSYWLTTRAIKPSILISVVVDIQWIDWICSPTICIHWLCIPI